MSEIETQIKRLRENDFAGMETMRTFALGIIDGLRSAAPSQQEPIAWVRVWPDGECSLERAWADAPRTAKPQESDGTVLAPVYAAPTTPRACARMQADGEMTMDDNYVVCGSNIAELKPIGELRYARRYQQMPGYADGIMEAKLILQQKWVASAKMQDGGIWEEWRWRDVPIVDERATAQPTPAVME